MNGYELAEKILARANWNVVPLLELANGVEGEWLELKAAISPKDGVFIQDKKNGRLENKQDYFWDVSKALFALTNSIGGVLILGISEVKVKGESTVLEPVGLEASGFKGDKDEFLRALDNQIFRPTQWKTATSGTWTCHENHQQFSPRWASFKGRDVLAILVRPRVEAEMWLDVEHSDLDGITSRVVFYRPPGDLGQSREMKTPSMTWWKSRSTQRNDLHQLFQNFIEKWTRDGKHPSQQIQGEIANYIKRVDQSYRIASTIFTNLSATLDINSSNYLPDASPFLTEGLHQQARQREPRTASVLDMLLKQRRVVLLGDPGAGKSFCLQKLAFDLVENWQVGRPLPLLVQLHRYGESGLIGLVMKELPSLYWIDIESEIASGQIILIFDGLNECPSVYYDNCSQEINSLLNDYPSSRVIVSSRITHNPQQLKLPTFAISPMDEDQQRNFLNAYLGGRDKVAEVLTKLHTHHSVHHVAGNPFLLHLVATIAKNSPDYDFLLGRARLYDQFLTSWHAEESDKNRRNGSSALWHIGRVKDALSLLAFSMRVDGKVSVTINRARGCLEPIMGNDVGRFIDRIAQGLLLVVDEKNESVYFSHETILEYLAAVYLSRNPEKLTPELLDEKAGGRTSNWVMPLIFAFELLENPPSGFIQNAWSIEPLVVAACLRDNAGMARLSVDKQDDLWTKGLLRILRGDPYIQESRDLVCVGRFPPKHPLSENLVSTLRGASLWYALQSHKEGINRKQRLLRALVDRNAIWMELLPHACAGNPEIRELLSDAQKVFMGDVVPTPISKLLSGMSVRELCSLTWHRKIQGTHFLSMWREALDRCPNECSDSALIALLSTSTRLGKNSEAFRTDQFNADEIRRLKDISGNWLLSLKVLNILLRDGIVSPRDLQDDTGRINDIINRMSEVNAFKLLKMKVVHQHDIPKERLDEILSKMDSRMRAELIEKKIITLATIDSAIRDRSYSLSDLQDDLLRKKIQNEIAAKTFDGEVANYFPEKLFGFFKNDKFRDGVYFHVDKIRNPQNRSFTKGSCLSVHIEIRYNKKKNEFDFSVRNGEIVPATER